jgi:hypothetical protein
VSSECESGISSHTIDEHKAKVEKCINKPESNCDEHKKEYILYCKACNIPICHECKRSSHSSHKTQPPKLAIFFVARTVRQRGQENVDLFLSSCSKQGVQNI